MGTIPSRFFCHIGYEMNIHEYLTCAKNQIIPSSPPDGATIDGYSPNFHIDNWQLRCKSRHTCTELGIKYQHSTSQSLGDQWWFWCCENVPEDLPKYITDLNPIDPMECIGYGLSKEDAEKIRDYE